MRVELVCLAILLAIFSPSLAAIPQAWRDDADLRDAHFVDDQYGWAVGDLGTIWHTQNGGEIWREQTSGVDCQLSSVFFLDKKIGYAAGGEIVPLTYRSRGVFLRTIDGGRTWQRTDGLLLPWISKIHFHSTKNGYATGATSSLYPNGCWVTHDAGRTWSPINGVEGDWSDASFLNRAKNSVSGLLVSRTGTIAWLANDRLLRAGQLNAPPNLGSRSFVAMLQPSVGVAGNASPTWTADGGRSWQAFGNAISKHAGVDFNPTTFAAQDGHVWMAGNPGTTIWHSEDLGQNWQVAQTHAALPIHRLYFQSKERGWAIGSRGLILSTRDGGATWKQQRGRAKRAGLMAVFADEADIPWDLLTQTSAQQAYRVHIVLLAAKDHDSLRCDLDRRLASAAAQIGASSEVLTQLPYPAGSDASPEDLIVRWTKLNPHTIDQLTQTLAARLRTHRPDVVVTSASAKSPKGSQQLLKRLLLDAQEFSAHPEMYPEQLAQHKLQPWTVSRVLQVQPMRGKSVALDAIPTDRGPSITDLSTRAERLVAPSLTSKSSSLFTVDDVAAPTEVGRYPMLETNAQYDSAQRRPRTIASATQKQTMQKLAQARRIAHAERLVGSGQQRIEQITRLLQDDVTRLGDLFFEIATAEAARGEFEEAQFLFRHLAENHPDHPLADQSLEWLVGYHTSLERQWMRPDSATTQQNQSVQLAGGASDGQPRVQVAVARFPAGIPKRPEPIRITSAQAPLDAQTLKEIEEEVARDFANGKDPAAGLTSADPIEAKPQEPPNDSDKVANKPNEIEDAETAKQDLPFKPNFGVGLQLARLLKTKRPMLYGEPSLLLPLAAITRDSGQPKIATGFHRQLQRLSAKSIWRQRANVELRLENGDREKQDVGIWTSIPLAERPHLDGGVNDACYTVATLMELQNGQGLPPTQVAIGHDDEFLYLAAACPKRAKAEYQPKRRPRPRDAQLSSLDRLRFRFDINRDYASWWNIEIDHRGWTRDSLEGRAGISDASWNPKYYVASDVTEENWTIEVAIPLDQLAPSEYQNGNWVFSVERIVPQVGIERWTSKTGPKIDSDLQGVLHLKPL